MKDQTVKEVTLRRDLKGPLKFSGIRIGSASRTWDDNGENGELLPKHIEMSFRLFVTASSQYVYGGEAYNRTDEEYRWREAYKADSLQELAEILKTEAGLDDKDVLAELFEDTEIGDQFVEHVE